MWGQSFIHSFIRWVILPPSVSISSVIEKCRLSSVIAKNAIGVLAGVPAACI